MEKQLEKITILYIPTQITCVMDVKNSKFISEDKTYDIPREDMNTHVSNVENMCIRTIINSRAHYCITLDYGEDEDPRKYLLDSSLDKSMRTVIRTLEGKVI